MIENTSDSRILGIENRTENWKTARYFAPLFGDEAIGLARRLGENGDIEPRNVRLELYWSGVRDFLFEKFKKNDTVAERDLRKCRIQESYRRLFFSLRDEVVAYRGLRVKESRNYSASEKERLFNNLIHTEIDIVLDTPRTLFIGEVKHQMDLGANSNLVLVHQLIRQYVMAKILADLTNARKEIASFVVGVYAKKRQVQFMIDHKWMDRCNVLTWDDIKQLVSPSEA